MIFFAIDGDQTAIFPTDRKIRMEIAMFEITKD